MLIVVYSIATITPLRAFLGVILILAGIFVLYVVWKYIRYATLLVKRWNTSRARADLQIRGIAEGYNASDPEENKRNTENGPGYQDTIIFNGLDVANGVVNGVVVESRVEEEIFYENDDEDLDEWNDESYTKIPVIPEGNESSLGADIESLEDSGTVSSSSQLLKGFSTFITSPELENDGNPVVPSAEQIIAEAGEDIIVVSESVNDDDVSFDEVESSKDEVESSKREEAKDDKMILIDTVTNSFVPIETKSSEENDKYVIDTNFEVSYLTGTEVDSSDDNVVTADTNLAINSDHRIDYLSQKRNNNRQNTSKSVDKSRVTSPGNSRPVDYLPSEYIDLLSPNDLTVNADDSIPNDSILSMNSPMRHYVGYKSPISPILTSGSYVNRASSPVKHSRPGTRETLSPNLNTITNNTDEESLSNIDFSNVGNAEEVNHHIIDQVIDNYLRKKQSKRKPKQPIFH